MKDEANITFYGGVDSVTGANFILTLKDERGSKEKIMIDCGLAQGESAEEENCKPFRYRPEEIDFLIVTHAHIDHIGRIPKLVKDGFKGKILSTAPTKEMALPMLLDAAGVMRQSTRDRKDQPLFEERDIYNCFERWESINYVAKTPLGIASVFLRDAGHILGSAIAEITFADKKIVFTGDLGNSPSPLLKDTEYPQNADFLIMESVYGDRNHESKEERLFELKDILNQAIKKGGVILIPSFSIEKTQVILSELNFLVETNKVRSVPVFLDSPLAIKITGIYRKYSDYFNDKAKEKINSGDDIFDFPRLILTKTTEESQKIKDVPGPKIIIAGSGMSSGGRILSHEKRYLSDPKNTIIFLGYQAAGTLGRKIEEGIKKVKIDGEEISVLAEVKKISGYSSHKDSDGLVDFVAKSGANLKEVFVVMGEPKSSSFLAERIKDELGIKALCPEKEKTYKLF